MSGLCVSDMIIVINNLILVQPVIILKIMRIKVRVDQSFYKRFSEAGILRFIDCEAVFMALSLVLKYMFLSVIPFCSCVW